MFTLFYNYGLITKKPSYIIISNTQSALGDIDNIAFPPSSNKGKPISPFSPEYEFTRNPPVAQRLPTSEVRNVFPRLSHPF